MTIIPKNILGLDIGSKRIGVAIARGGVRLAVPLLTVSVDGGELQAIGKILTDEAVDLCVVGLPRNQQGEETKQSKYTRQVASNIKALGVKISWQDESLTSVKASELLVRDKSGHLAQCGVDAVAASLILQDYLETI